MDSGEITATFTGLNTSLAEINRTIEVCTGRMNDARYNFITDRDVVIKNISSDFGLVGLKDSRDQILKNLAKASELIGKL